MASIPLRIAILECDSPLDRTRAKYGSYGGVFTALLKAGADALQHPGLSSSTGLSLSTYDIVHGQKYPSLEDIDAVLLTGSKFNSFDNDPWILKLVEFTKEVLAQTRVRIVGVCFGHQIVGRAMGVKVDRSEGGWETSVTAIDLTKKGQEIFGRPALVLLPPLQTLQPTNETLRHSTKCTAMQYTHFPQTLNNLPIQQRVRIKVCTFPKGLLQYKATQNLTKRLWRNFWRRGMKVEFLMMRGFRIAWRGRTNIKMV